MGIHLSKQLGQTAILFEVLNPEGVTYISQGRKPWVLIRIPVELIVRKLGEGGTIEDILDGYPNLSKDAVRAAFLYAADLIGNEPWEELKISSEQDKNAQVSS